MKRAITVLVLVILGASYALAGTIARPSKTGTDCGGGTAFIDGCKPNAADFNNEFDTIHNLVNGNIDNDNISGSAAIAQSKIVDPDLDEIADYSADADGQDADSSPGDYTTRTLATDLATEIEQLRYKLAEACGTQSAVRVNGSGVQDVGWVELCAKGPNIVENASFLNDGGDGDADPINWAEVASGTMGALTVSTANGMGAYLAGGGATTGDGISYTADRLKASTKYLITAEVSLQSGDAELTTTGAIATGEWRNISAGSLPFSGSAVVPYSAVVATDTVPADLVVRFLCTDGAACAFRIYSFAIQELTATTVREEEAHFIQTDTDTTHSCDGGEDVTDISIQVYIPDSGYMVRVRVEGSWVAAGSGTLTLDIEQGTTSLTPAVLVSAAAAVTTSQLFSMERWAFPTGAGAQTFTFDCTATSSTFTLGGLYAYAEVIKSK